MPKVKIIQQFSIPNQPDFILGDDYDIMEPLATILRDRGLVALYPEKKEAKNNKK